MNEQQGNKRRNKKTTTTKKLCFFLEPNFNCVSLWQILDRYNNMKLEKYNSIQLGQGVQDLANEFFEYHRAY